MTGPADPGDGRVIDPVLHRVRRLKSRASRPSHAPDLTPIDSRMAGMRPTLERPNANPTRSSASVRGGLPGGGAESATREEDRDERSPRMEVDDQQVRSDPSADRRAARRLAGRARGVVLRRLVLRAIPPGHRVPRDGRVPGPHFGRHRDGPRIVDGSAIATIRCIDTHVLDGWVPREGRDDLLRPEDLQGQTVVGLAEGRVEGFTSEDDPFIWTQFHPSPDALLVAIVGCYWACPYEVVVYDFRRPMSLPLPVVARFALPDSDSEFNSWIAAMPPRCESPEAPSASSKGWGATQAGSP